MSNKMRDARIMKILYRIFKLDYIFSRNNSIIFPELQQPQILLVIHRVLWLFQLIQELRVTSSRDLMSIYYKNVKHNLFGKPNQLTESIMERCLRIFDGQFMDLKINLYKQMTVKTNFAQIRLNTSVISTDKTNF